MVNFICAKMEWFCASISFIKSMHNYVLMISWACTLHDKMTPKSLELFPKVKYFIF